VRSGGKRTLSSRSKLTSPFVRAIRLRRESVPDFDAYPFAIPAIHELQEVPLRSPVTFLGGENGSGKSTLLEAVAIAAGFNAEGGSRNFNFATVRAHSDLHEYITLVRGPVRERDGFFLRSESFFNVSTEIDTNLGPGLAIQHYGGRSLHAWSHGESLIALLTNRLWGNGLYLFDEPEAALSPLRQLSCLAVLRKQVLSGSQFIIATHSPIIMAYPGATILQFGDHEIRSIPYEETEHFTVTSDFLADRGRMLDVLFEGLETGEDD
jgi:predicted ATPase